MFRRARALQLRNRLRARREYAVALEVQQGLGEQFFQMFFHGMIFPARPGRVSERSIVNR